MRRVILSLVKSVAGGDPDFDSVVLLLDFAGADEATDITDLSGTPKTETFVGNAEVDTTVNYLDTNSLQCGTTGNITYPDDDDWDFPSDFTIESGVYWPAGRSTRGIISSHASGEGWALQSAENGANEDINFIGNGVQLMNENAGVLATQEWHHVAVTRSGTDLRMFFNGVQLGSTTTNSTSIAGTQDLTLGALDSPASQLFTGNLAAVRITKGVARYTANFTPPTVFYPTS